LKYVDQDLLERPLARALTQFDSWIKAGTAPKRYHSKDGFIVIQFLVEVAQIMRKREGSFEEKLEYGVRHSKNLTNIQMLG
jgi:hypothetical protein